MDRDNSISGLNAESIKRLIANLGDHMDYEMLASEVAKRVRQDDANITDFDDVISVARDLEEQDMFSWSCRADQIENKIHLNFESSPDISHISSEEVEPDAHNYQCEECGRDKQLNKKHDVLEGVKCGEHPSEGRFIYDKPLYSSETIRSAPTAYVVVECQMCGCNRTVKRSGGIDEGDKVRVRCSGCSFIQEEDTVREHEVVGKLVQKEVFYP